MRPSFILFICLVYWLGLIIPHSIGKYLLRTVPRITVPRIRYPRYHHLVIGSLKHLAQRRFCSNENFHVATCIICTLFPFRPMNIIILPPVHTTNTFSEYKRSIYVLRIGVLRALFHLIHPVCWLVFTLLCNQIRLPFPGSASPAHITRITRPALPAMVYDWMGTCYA